VQKVGLVQGTRKLVGVLASGVGNENIHAGWEAC
jgi:hypothetical protein